MISPRAGRREWLQLDAGGARVARPWERRGARVPGRSGHVPVKRQALERALALLATKLADQGS
ncbi:MAG: hypothetical protein FJ299_05880 [Planctomycetes bacterium]|nr:hypothetical protein [Planctomycetota bacterium]